MKKTTKIKMFDDSFGVLVEDDATKSFLHPRYNFRFRKEDGLFLRWGATKEDDGDESIGLPEICDMEISEYTDSLHSYHVFNNLGSYLKDSKLFQNIVEETKKLMKDKNVEICWIKAHCGVYGNEIADQLSTRAKNVNRNMPFCNKPYDFLDKINLFEYEFNYSFEIDKIILDTTAKKYDI